MHRPHASSASGEPVTEIFKIIRKYQADKKLEEFNVSEIQPAVIRAGYSEDDLRNALLEYEVIFVICCVHVVSHVFWLFLMLFCCVCCVVADVGGVDTVQRRRNDSIQPL